MDEDLQDFLQEFGRPTEYISADERVLQHFSGKVPPILIDFWRKIGFSVFKNGLLTVVNPLEWIEATDEWLEDTGLDELDEFIPIFKGAFGNFHLFGIKTGHRPTLSPVTGFIFADDKNASSFISKGGDWVIKMLFGLRETRNFDIKDDDGAPLFDRAVAKLGSLKSDEMFGFVPLPMLGGTFKLELLQKYDAQVHLSILRQMTEVKVVWI
ncbi:GAD-like domain protein [compost metagenome]